MKRILVVLLVLFSALLSQAQLTIAEGTIGTYPIVMEIRAFDSTLIEMNYFYVKHKKTISLSGKLKRDGTFSVNNSYDPDAQPKSDVEKIDLRQSGDTFTGLWTLDKKRLPVKLKTIAVDKLKSPYGELLYVEKLKKDNPYNYVLLSGLLFNKDSVTKHNGYTVDWYTEKYTHIPMIQVRNDNNVPAIAELNNYLKEFSLDHCINLSSCNSPSGEGDYTLMFSSVYLNGKIFSMNTCVSLYCGGAHPDNSCEGYNFDMTTNSKIDIRDLLWSASDDDSVFARHIAELYSELYPDKMEKEVLENGCDYSETYIWEYPNWFFTEKGIYVGPVFPYVMQACSFPEWALIPYDIVKKYMNPANAIQLPK